MVFEYIPHVPFRELLAQITPLQVKCYMYQLLIALSHMQKQRIIHRDIKPSNFLFDPATNRGKTIDCGLCETDISIQVAQPVTEGDLDRVKAEKTPLAFEYPHLYQNRPKMIGNRAGTRGFRSPEVLMAGWNQSCRIDVWSAGVILLCLLTKRYPFFKSGDDVESLCEVAAVVGSHRLELAALEVCRRVSFPATYREVDLKELVIALYPPIIREHWDDSVFDLLTKLLEPVPSKRPFAREAAHHPFFADLPEEIRSLPKE